jgi:hypothetical protein
MELKSGDRVKVREFYGTFREEHSDDGTARVDADGTKGGVWVPVGALEKVEVFIDGAIYQDQSGNVYVYQSGLRYPFELLVSCGRTVRQAPAYSRASLTGEVSLLSDFGRRADTSGE